MGTLKVDMWSLKMISTVDTQKCNNTKYGTHIEQRFLYKVLELKYNAHALTGLPIPCMTFFNTWSCCTFIIVKIIVCVCDHMCEAWIYINLISILMNETTKILHRYLIILWSCFHNFIWFFSFAHYFCLFHPSLPSM